MKKKHTGIKVFSWFDFFSFSRTTKTVKKYRKSKIRFSTIPYRSGDELLFMGARDVRIKLIIEQTKRVSCRYENTILQIRCSDVLLKDGAVSRAIKNWYKREAKKYIYQRLDHYASSYSFHYNTVRLKWLTSRFGSCSSKKNLNFNIHLIKAPKDIIDYVIVHELCHLREMNHSRAFWYEVESILPHYKDMRKWLRQHGQQLIYDV